MFSLTTVLTNNICICFFFISVHLLFVYVLLCRAYCKWLYLTWALCLVSSTVFGIIFHIYCFIVSFIFSAFKDPWYIWKKVDGRPVGATDLGKQFMALLIITVITLTWSLRIQSDNRARSFPGIARNAGTHRNDRKFHKSHKLLNQTKRNINKLCLGKISHHKTVRIKFSLDSGFSNELYSKKWKLGNAGN